MSGFAVEFARCLWTQAAGIRKEKVANPDILKSAIQSEKKSSTNQITCGRMNPDIFESDDVANSCPVSYRT